jgi:hypothetical protein
MKKEKRKKGKNQCCINKTTRPWLLTNANNRVQNTTTQLPLLSAVCERRGEERRGDGDCMVLPNCTSKDTQEQQQGGGGR